MCHVGDLVCYFCDTKIVKDTLIQRCEAYALKCFGRNELKREDIQIEWDDFSRFIPRDVGVPSFAPKDCPFKRIAEFKVFDYPCPNFACKRSPKERSDNKIPNSFIRSCDSVTHFYAPELLSLVEWFNKYIENCNNGAGSSRNLIAPFEVNVNQPRLDTVSSPVYRDSIVEDLVKCTEEQEAQNLKENQPAMECSIGKTDSLSGTVDQTKDDTQGYNETDSLFGNDENNATLTCQSIIGAEGDEIAQSAEMDVDTPNTPGACDMAELDQELEAAFDDVSEVHDINTTFEKTAENPLQEQNSSITTQNAQTSTDNASAMDEIEEFNKGLISFEFEDVTFHDDEPVDDATAATVMNQAAVAPTPQQVVKQPLPVSSTSSPTPAMIRHTTPGSFAGFSQGLPNGVAPNMMRTGKIIGQAYYSNAGSFAMPQNLPSQLCGPFVPQQLTESPGFGHESPASTPEMGRSERPPKSSKKPANTKKKTRRSTEDTTAAERQQALLKSLAESEAAKARKNAEAAAMNSTFLQPTAPTAHMDRAPSRSSSLGSHASMQRAPSAPMQRAPTAPMQRVPSAPTRGYSNVKAPIITNGQVVYMEDPFVDNMGHDQASNTMGFTQRRMSMMSTPSPLKYIAPTKTRETTMPYQHALPVTHHQQLHQRRASRSVLDGSSDAELAKMGFVRTSALSTAEAVRLGIDTSPVVANPNDSVWVQHAPLTSGSGGSHSSSSPLKRPFPGTLESDTNDDGTDLTVPGNGEQPARRTSKKRKSDKASCLDLFSSGSDQSTPVMTAAIRDALAWQPGSVPATTAVAPTVIAGGSGEKPSGEMDMMELLKGEQKRFQEEQKAAQEAFQMRMQQMMQGRGGQ